jgi:hypothetical protein
VADTEEETETEEAEAGGDRGREVRVAEGAASARWDPVSRRREFSST